MIYQIPVMGIKLSHWHIAPGKASRSMKVAFTRLVSLRHVDLFRVAILTYTGERIIDSVGTIS
jgi:hypothetical protein